MRSTCCAVIPIKIIESHKGEKRQYSNWTEQKLLMPKLILLVERPNVKIKSNLEYNYKVVQRWVQKQEHPLGEEILRHSLRLILILSRYETRNLWIPSIHFSLSSSPESLYLMVKKEADIHASKSKICASFAHDNLATTSTKFTIGKSRSTYLKFPVGHSNQYYSLKVEWHQVSMETWHPTIDLLWWADHILLYL